MNCYFSDLKLHRGSWLLSRHTHQHTYFSQSDDSSCPASFALKQLPQELLYWNFFVCLSFPNLWPHTLVQCDRQPLPFGSYSVLHPTPPHPSTPHVFCTALRHVCVVRQMSRKAGQTSETAVGTQQRGPPTSELYNRNLTACSHEEYHSFSPADACRELMLWTHMHSGFFFVLYTKRNSIDANILSRYLSDFL